LMAQDDSDTRERAPIEYSVPRALEWLDAAIQHCFTDPEIMVLCDFRRISSNPNLVIFELHKEPDAIGEIQLLNLPQAARCKLSLIPPKYPDLRRELDKALLKEKLRYVGGDTQAAEKRRKKVEELEADRKMWEAIEHDVDTRQMTAFGAFAKRFFELMASLEKFTIVDETVRRPRQDAIENVALLRAVVDKRLAPSVTEAMKKYGGNMRTYREYIDDPDTQALVKVYLEDKAEFALAQQKASARRARRRKQ
jgi:hypothetical protein